MNYVKHGQKKTILFTISLIYIVYGWGILAEIKGIMTVLVYIIPVSNAMCFVPKGMYLYEKQCPLSANKCTFATKFRTIILLTRKWK